MSYPRWVWFVRVKQSLEWLLVLLCSTSCHIWNANVLSFRSKCPVSRDLAMLSLSLSPFELRFSQMQAWFWPQCPLMTFGLFLLLVFRVIKSSTGTTVTQQSRVCLQGSTRYIPPPQFLLTASSPSAANAFLPPFSPASFGTVHNMS